MLFMFWTPRAASKNLIRVGLNNFILLFRFSRVHFPSVSLSISLSLYLSISFCLFVSLCLTLCPAVYLLLCLSLSVSLSLFFFFYLFNLMATSLSLSLSVALCLYLPLSVSFRLSLSLSFPLSLSSYLSHYTISYDQMTVRHGCTKPVSVRSVGQSMTGTVWSPFSPVLSTPIKEMFNPWILYTECPKIYRKSALHLL